MDMDLANLSIDQIESGLAGGEYDTVTLTKAYLTRIEQLEPQVNAVLEVNPDALALADKLDGERRDGKLRGPLHGIPILLKGNIDSGDRMATTTGSLALAGSIAPEDAFVVRRLRRAGALILGKANLSEWANMRSSRSSTGWSSEGGQTRNPYDLNRSPGGSSSGSGVAVAAGMCTAALGTETDGSVVIPASMNGLVGIKPSIGTVGRTGIIPISHNQDTAGPIARTVRDAVLLLDAMLGLDANDPLAREAPSSDSTSDSRTSIQSTGVPQDDRRKWEILANRDLEPRVSSRGSRKKNRNRVAKRLARGARLPKTER